MPKAKKFIDKKNSVTFHLVHRSQHDPLIADETAPQRVLVPARTEKKGKDRNKNDLEKRKEEQRKYGIFFDDDYNYLQHLRNTNEVIKDWDFEAPPIKEEDFPPLKGQGTNSLKEVKIQLPSSVFASNVEENVGMLNKAAPHTGLCLEVDPDIVAAMDEDFDFDNPDNQLEDNFMELATGEGGSDDNSNDGSEVDSGEEDDEVCSLGDGECLFEDEETKSRFTNYSMSSSVIRRNDQLALLDERFEQLYANYDDNEIGALDSEEIEGYLAPNSDIVLQCAEEFEKQKAVQMHETDKTIKLIENFDSEDEMDEMVEIEVPEKTEKWDCESVLSTYSNLYNHPKLIIEPKVQQRIRVNARTGIPLNVLDGSGSKLTARTLAKFDAATGEDLRNICTKSVISTLSSLSIRPKNETIEEKKERKKAIKEYRKVRRVERKLNTDAFKEEKKRQEKIILNNKSNILGVKIL